jgi:hypothetical protein
MIPIQYHELKLVNTIPQIYYIYKNFTPFEELKGVKHSSLLCQRLNYIMNMFYNIGLGLVSSKGFFKCSFLHINTVISIGICDTGWHDTQHNVIQLNDIQHNDIQHNDTCHNDIQHDIINKTQPSA